MHYAYVCSLCVNLYSCVCIAMYMFIDIFIPFTAIALISYFVINILK